MTHFLSSVASHGFGPFMLFWFTCIGGIALLVRVLPKAVRTAAESWAARVRRQGYQKRNERAYRELREAHRQVGDVVQNAKIAMEEAAGLRRRGERRMSDGFGNWRSML